MKKLITILGIFLIAVSALFYYMYLTREQPTFTQPTSIVWGSVSGRSMQPTINDKAVISYDTSLTPKIGDIVFFKCFTTECKQNDNDSRVKRLTKINEQGCYWFEGDNPERSWDSRNYGYLCPPNDVSIEGVVVSIN